MTQQDYQSILVAAQQIARDRMQAYGDPDACFERAAVIASALLGRKVTAHDLFMSQVAIKLTRIANDVNHMDSYIDGVNYLAFAGGAAMRQAQKTNGSSLRDLLKTNSNSELEPELEWDRAPDDNG
jgi:hypothetical protein